MADGRMLNRFCTYLSIDPIQGLLKSPLHHVLIACACTRNGLSVQRATKAAVWSPSFKAACDPGRP